MGKPQKKRGLADKVRKTKTSNEIKNNPFEVKINRKKFDILGRKTKHDVGLPGVSRSKAIKKRQETLLKEYKQKSKSNKFVDRRFGEYDTKIAPEDKILKRFALERQRMQDKKNIYNLNEEEELTHFGQSLSEIEKLNDVVDSDSESEDKGLLSAEFTESHFGGGGGLLKKKNAEEEGNEGDGKPRSRQELIEELIIKSKQEKHERQTQKEEARVLTEKLDQDWKSIQSLMARNAPKSVCRVEESKPKAEEYDMMVRELGFEMKAQPSEKMKTPEEVAREERDRLQKLEADRQRRMLGDIEEETSKKQSYLSADDLNDGFILDKEDRQMLSYQDGKWNIEDENQNADDEDDDDDDGGDGGDDDDDDDDDQHGESGSEEEGSEAESGHSDLDSEKDVVEDDDAEVPRKAENQATPHSTLSKEERLAEREQAKAENQATPHSTLSKEERLAEQEQAKAENQATPHSTLSKEERLAEREQAKAELPYTFPAPESFSDLRSLLDGYSADEQCVILERIQKCNHPSLAAGNKLKLQKMFGFLLEYVGDLATRCPPDLGTVNKLVPHLYGLCQLFPNAAYLAMQNVLSDSAHDMEDILEVKGRATLPGLGTLIYLKIVAVLFPTSDFRHPVTTPALVYISQLLTKCPITSLEEVTGGLILCCLTMEYVTLSQRFVPELVSYLLGILHLAVRDKSSLGYCVVPPFKLTGRHCNLLVTSDAAHAESWSQMPLPLSGAQSLKLKDNLERDHYKLSCLATCLDLVKRCTSMYKSLPSFTQIFCPIRILLSKHISVEGHSSGLQDLHREALEAVSTSPESPSPLVFEKTKPIPLRLFTPKIVEVLDFGKKRGSSKQEREREKLKHKYRKELKGALREMRKDTKFLAREKLTEIMNRDAERKRKVKELFGSLSTQEGEWKALKKKKRK